MAGVFIAFLVWLFATGKYSDWAALAGVTMPNSGGATGTF
jgi:ABC-type microcin C transport system permease subunit YejB